MLVRRVLLLLFLLSWALPVRARSLPDLDDYADESLGMDASAGLLAGFAYHSAAVGCELNFAYPILPDGLFDHAVYLDGLHLSLGLDFWRFSWNETDGDVELMYFAPNFGLRYTVYLLDTLAPYLWLRVGPAFAHAQGTGEATRLYWSAGVGLLWDFLDWLSLRTEFDWGRFRDTLRVGLLVRF